MMKIVCIFAKKLIVDIMQFCLIELKCEHCGETFSDGKNAVVDYLTHQDTYHKDMTNVDGKVFEDFRKKMIKQKDNYEKSKEKTGDSDLVFNAKERDSHHHDKISN
jgi:hypothetical protein